LTTTSTITADKITNLSSTVQGYAYINTVTDSTTWGGNTPLVTFSKTNNTLTVNQDTLINKINTCLTTSSTITSNKITDLSTTVAGYGYLKTVTDMTNWNANNIVNPYISFTKNGDDIRVDRSNLIGALNTIAGTTAVSYPLINVYNTTWNGTTPSGLTSGLDTSSPPLISAQYVVGNPTSETPNVLSFNYDKLVQKLNTYALSSSLSNYFPKSGGTFTGSITTPGFTSTSDAVINGSLTVSAVYASSGSTFQNATFNGSVTMNSPSTINGNFTVSPTYTLSTDNTSVSSVLSYKGQDVDSRYLKLTGGTVTGAVTFSNTVSGSTINATSNLQEAGTNLSAKYARLANANTFTHIITAPTINATTALQVNGSDISTIYAQKALL